MRNFITLIALTVLLAGCYNQKKAVDQMTRGIQQYEDTARKIFRDKFPCITTTIDSSKFLGSIKDLEFLLYRKNDSLRKTAARLQAVRDSFRLVQARSGDDCPQLLAQVTDYVAKLHVENQDLKEDAEEFKRRLRNIQPVTEKVKDSSEIKDANQARDKALQELNKTRADRDHYKNLWNGYEKKKAGAIYVLFIQWEWILFLAAGLFLWAKWKSVGGWLKKITSLFTKK